MRNFLSAVLVFVVLCSAASCKKKNANPAGPTNTASAWTGTLTRPSGLGTITVNWPSTSVDDGGIQKFSGPMTLTFNGVSVTVPEAQGIPSGNSSSGFDIHVDFTANQIASIPTCSIHANNASASSADPFPSPHTSINTLMDVRLNGCVGFIGATTQSLVRENQQMSLTK